MDIPVRNIGKKPSDIAIAFDYLVFLGIGVRFGSKFADNRSY